MAQYALRILDCLLDYARRVGDAEQVSVKQFFVSAIAEKVSALKTEAWFRENGRLEDVDAYMRGVEAQQASKYRTRPVHGMGAIRRRLATSRIAKQQ